LVPATDSSLTLLLASQHN